MLEMNPDAEYYEWVKLDADNEGHRKLVADLWCAYETIGGKPVADGQGVQVSLSSPRLLNGNQRALSRVSPSTPQW